MIGYKEKMSEFVARLWSNPSIRSASVLKKENQIIAFVKDNPDTLKSALMRPGFFPDLTYEDILRLLFSELTNLVVRTLTPMIRETVASATRTEVLNVYGDEEEEKPLRADRLETFILTSIRSKIMRDQFVSVLEAISYGFFEKYIPFVTARRKVIYYDMIRRDRLSEEGDLIPACLNLATLLRPLFWYRIPHPAPGVKGMVSLSSSVRDRRVFSSVQDSLERFLKHKVGTIPSAIFRQGMESWLDAGEYPNLTGQARLIKILVSRAQEFDPDQEQDRGAESPDKSWFHINRRTYKYYGYDPRFLDELYQIASEEGW